MKRFLALVVLSGCGGSGVVRNVEGDAESARALFSTSTAPVLMTDYWPTRALFSTSTAPVLMTDYWPTRALSRLYRVPAGRIYYKHVIEPVDPRASEAGSVLSARAGTVAYLLHDYFDRDGTNVDARFWGDTWHLRNTPSTGEVSEVADTFPQRNATNTADLESCTSPCYGRIAIYNGQVIGHGRPGGHQVGEAAYAQSDIRWWYSGSGAAPYQQLGPEYGSWSEVRLLEKLDRYTPPYGRDASGFGKGRAPTYEGVIKVLFAHGNRVAPMQEPHCTNQPASFAHRPGTSSFWQVLWLAPNVGIIQFENLFYEPRCDGSVLHAEGVDGDWFAYLDVLQELGTGTPPTCTARPDEVVVNSCASVGYPASYVGSYVSRRSWSCTTNTWSDWRRENTCAAPVCTPQADQVVVNSCASVGYPTSYVGSYVSRRSWSCSLNGWGDWRREDTCAPP